MSTTDPLFSSEKASGQKPHSPLAIAILIVLVTLVAAIVFGQDYLPDPYYAVAHLAAYALAVVVIWRDISRCRRLAETIEIKGKLLFVRFWVVMAVIGLLDRVNEVYHSTDRHAIWLATDISLLLALWVAVGLVNHLLTSAAPSTEAAVASIEPENH